MDTKAKGLAALETKGAAERGAELRLNDAEGNPTDMYIRLIGADAEDFRKAERRVVDRATQEMVKNRNKFRKTAQQVEQEQVDLMVVATKGWRTGQEPVFYDAEGNPLAFSEANARKVYSEFPLVLEQVAEFVRDRANFSTR